MTTSSRREEAKGQEQPHRPRRGDEDTTSTAQARLDDEGGPAPQKASWKQAASSQALLSQNDDLYMVGATSRLVDSSALKCFVAKKVGHNHQRLVQYKELRNCPTLNASFGSAATEDEWITYPTSLDTARQHQVVQKAQKVTGELGLPVPTWVEPPGQNP
ncbi:hypothetical protein HPB50_001362 [Hyalomma asiaticum]|uniref:Uncharacterized protein n=1 Tax=Hyalomma asiaticum TaxID=266040 RepID=A0ACB7RRW9_HYAAI|nr:hypothetical protein HPB50_001362 [Hyalomma asiaticum]